MRADPAQFVCECLRVAEVVAAVDADIPSWLGRVGEVEPLFGPMLDFETHLRRGITRGTALCVRRITAEHIALCGEFKRRAVPVLRVRTIGVRVFG